MNEYSLINFVRNTKYLVKRRTDIQMGEFEEKIGISRGYLSRIENGKQNNMPAKTMIAIAEELQMYIDDIFFYDTSADELNDMKAEEEKLKEALADLQARIKERER